MSLSHRPNSHQTEREDANSSIFKKKKLLTDTIKQKKHELTQEFKESYREKNVKVAENTESILKPNEHKLRHALDNLLAENNTRNTRLNELNLRLDIMRRDDINGVELNEKSIEETFERSIELESDKKQKACETGATNNFKEGKELIEKFVSVKQTLANLMKRRTEEEEIQKALEARISGMTKSQKVMTDRIGKKGVLYNMMQKRFINLGKTEFAAENKLTRSKNKLLSRKKEVEKQQAHEDDYFNQKRNALKRNKLVVEEHKDVIAKNLLYLEQVKQKKEEVDEQLEEVDYEEKQIVTKRQASEYILLYIELLENLESEYLSSPSPGSPPRSTRAIKDKSKSMVPVKREGVHKSGAKIGLKRSFSKDFESKDQSFSDTNKDRDIVITKIAQFYDKHPEGINAFVSTLLKIYLEMQLKEQSLSNTHQDINAQRLKRQNEVKRLESILSKFQHGFILLEDIEEEVEESSPEHVRETEKKVAGRLNKYDIKTVKLGEYLVNLCSTGIRDALLKLTNASCSLASRCGRRIPVEIESLAKEIEAFLSDPKSDFNSLDLQVSGNRSLIKPLPGTENNSAKDNADAQSKNRCTTDSSDSKDPNTDRTDKKEPSSRGDELSKVSQSQLSVNEEFTKFEQMFKNSFNKATPELIYKWNERVFEARWVFDYLTKSDIHRILEKYIYYYGNEITEGLLKSILQDMKNEARHAQRRRTNEAFSFMESLLLLYIQQHELRKSELSEEFVMEIKSEVLDDSNQGLAVSDHVEKAHEIRCQQLFMDSIVEDIGIKRKTEEKQATESDIDMVLFRKKDTQNPKVVKTTREAISDLHSRYQKERKGLATSFGQRSSSVPKLKMRIKKRPDSFEAPQVEETPEKGHQMKESGHTSEDKKHLAESALLMAKKRNSSCVITHKNSIGHIKANEDLLEEKESARKNIANKAEITSGTKDNKQAYFVPSSFYRAQKKSKDIEEFMKKIVKDEEILRKITLLEKRQTEFDKKSKDYDRRRDYVPNFSLLHKYDLNKEKRNDQTMQEWWRRQEAGALDFSDRGRSTTSLFMYSDKKGEKSPLPDQYTDSTINVLYSQNRKSTSRIAVKPWILPEEGVSQTARPDRAVVRVSKKRREGSLEDIENQLYIAAVSQTILESSNYKLEH